MSAFGTKKPGSDVNIQLGFPTIFQDAYADGRDTLRYFPSVPMKSPEVYAGDDLLAEVHQQRKREADHMVRAKVHSRKMMNSRALSSHAGYFGMPQAVLGQRKFANPSLGAFILNSARQDYRDAPFNYEGSGYEGNGFSGAGLTGGVLRTQAGAQFVKSKLADRIRQLQRIEEEKNMFLGAMPGMPGMPGAPPAMPSAPTAMTATPLDTGVPSENSAIELNLLFQNIEDALAAGTGKDGLDRITYGEALRVLQLCFRFVPSLDDDEIDRIINRVNRVISILDNAFLDPDADVENTNPGVYQRAFTLNELYERLNQYLLSMKAAFANPTRDMEIPASPDSVDAYGNVIKGTPRIFIPGGTPSRNIAGSRDRVELSKALVKSLGFSRLMGRAVDVAKIVQESKARSEKARARSRLAEGGAGSEDEGDDDAGGGGGGGDDSRVAGGAHGEVYASASSERTQQSLAERRAGGKAEFSVPGTATYAASGQASGRTGYIDTFQYANAMRAKPGGGGGGGLPAEATLLSFSRRPIAPTLALALAGRSAEAGEEQAEEDQQALRDASAASATVDAGELEGWAVSSAEGAPTLVGKQERMAGVARSAMAQGAKGKLGEAMAVARAATSPGVASYSASLPSSSSEEEEEEDAFAGADTVEDILRILVAQNSDWEENPDDPDNFSEMLDIIAGREPEYVDLIVEVAREKGWSLAKIVRQMKSGQEDGYTMFDDFIAENEGASSASAKPKSPPAKAKSPPASASASASSASASAKPKSPPASASASSASASAGGDKAKDWARTKLANHTFPANKSLQAKKAWLTSIGLNMGAGQPTEDASYEAINRALVSMYKSGGAVAPLMETAIRRAYYDSRPEWKSADGLNMTSSAKKRGLTEVLERFKGQIS